MSAVSAIHPRRNIRRALSSLRRRRLTPRRMHRGCRLRGKCGDVDPRFQVPPQGDSRTAARSGVGAGRPRTRRCGHAGAPGRCTGRSRAPSPQPPAGPRLQSGHHPRTRRLQAGELPTGDRLADPKARYAVANPLGAPTTTQQCPRRISMCRAVVADDLAGRRCGDHREHPRRSGTLSASRGREKHPSHLCSPNALKWMESGGGRWDPKTRSQRPRDSQIASRKRSGSRGFLKITPSSPCMRERLMM